ncbi:transposase [Paenibacillus sp. NPDC055715]
MDTEKRVPQVARELGISANTLYRLLAEYKQDGGEAFPGKGHLKTEDQVTRELQKRIRDLEQVNDILKKGHALFAKERH